MKEWFEDEEVWKALEPVLFHENRISAAPAEAQAILKLTQKTGGKLLDLGCGVGQHSIAFSKMGFDATGIDITPHYLEKAKKAAEKDKAKVEWILQDCRTFVRPDTYDLAINIGNSFGLSLNQQDDIGMLANVHKSLKKGGMLVMEMMGKEIMAKVFVSNTFDVLPDGTIIGQKNSITDSWGIIRNYRMIINKAQGKVTEMNLVHWLYSGHELRMFLTQLGFQGIRIYGGLDGSEYGINAQRLVIAAQK
jgi:SAM-dependent methyltransferase